MTLLRLAYLALALGLMGFGAIWCWLGWRRPTPPPRAARLVAALLLLLAAAGTAAAALLEARAVRPW